MTVQIITVHRAVLAKSLDGEFVGTQVPSANVSVGVAHVVITEARVEIGGDDAASSKWVSVVIKWRYVISSRHLCQPRGDRDKNGRSACHPTTRPVST